MMRFDGNSILLVDTDLEFLNHLAAELTGRGVQCFTANDMTSAKDLLCRYDFDLVVANYYLSDGIFYQLIDWCTANLSFLPIFTCVGHPFVGESELSRKHAIAVVFQKGDVEPILSGISKLLFNFQDFQQGLLEMIEPIEIKIEITVSDYNFLATPAEIHDDHMYLALDREFPTGTFGVLRFGFALADRYQSLIIPGFLDGRSASGERFVVDVRYLGHWKCFLDYLDMKQLNISKFLSKAAGF
jgi:hypothetical protein